MVSLGYMISFNLEGKKWGIKINSFINYVVLVKRFFKEKKCFLRGG